MPRPDHQATSDEQLTAYALGELPPGSAESAAVEDRLNQDEAARHEVESIRATADQLTAALAAEPVPVVLNASPSPRRWPMRLAVAGSLAAAAMIALALVLPSLRNDRRQASSIHALDASVLSKDALPLRNEPASGGLRRLFLSEPYSVLRDDHLPLASPADQSINGRTTPPVPKSEVPTLEHQAAVLEAKRILSNAIILRENTNNALSALDEAEVNLVALAPQHSQLNLIDEARIHFTAERDRLDREIREIKKSLVRYELYNTEAYDRVEDNPFLGVLDNPLSTFSVDVDTASYANVRRFLTQQGQLPPADAVRIEEMVNYFDYGYAPPAVVALPPLPPGEGGPQSGSGEGSRASDQLPDAVETSNRPHPNPLPEGEGAKPPAPFAAHVAVAAAPWSTSGGRLVRIGLKGVEVATDDRPAANLVFLLDVSGSMNNLQKLPLVKTGMKKLVEHLKMDDRIAIVVYAGASGLVLDSTTDHDAVLAAIDDLTPGGSTNGAAGIELAYDLAAQNHIPGGLNRVILCTDGDFNVGITDRGALTRLIEAKANLPEKPVTLTVLGFGSGNLKDATMEELSNRGDGNYGYVDSPREAEKLLAEQVNATLLTIAKDVKIQVEFNPAKVAAYRLIGYENRLLAKEDFNNDTVDAGDIGAGHTVTALYEVVPAGTKPNEDVGTNAAVDNLKYQRPAALSDAADSGELLTLKLRYKEPNAPKEQGTSKLLEFPVKDEGLAFEEADEDFRFAASVAGFGMLLRGSPHAGDLDFKAVQAMAEASTAEWADRLGILTPDQQRRLEFIDLVKRAGALADPAEEPRP